MSASDLNRPGASAAPPFATPQAKKHLGQHFLHDSYVIERIVRAIAPKPEDTLVEIGPGPGALTLPLLRRAGSLDVVEIDRDLIPVLEQAAQGIGELRVHRADALRFDYLTLAVPGRRLRLVGNLPYNISTPLLFHLLEYGTQIVDMHFMLQKEVVDRIVAGPGTPDYGRLSVAVAARADADSLFTIGPGAFRPPPKVDSAIVRIKPRPPAFEILDLDCFDRVVTAAFGQRRKQLGNALSSVMDADLIRAAGIDPRERAERLAAAEFAALANTVVHARVTPENPLETPNGD